MSNAWSGAARAGRALGKKVKDLGAGIGRGVGVGGDESSFGGERSRVWLEEWLEETRERLIQWLDESSFQRFVPFRAAFRRLLGTPKTPPSAPVVLNPPKRPVGPLGARPLGASTEESRRFREQIRGKMHEAHVRERAGLLDGQGVNPAPARSSSPRPAPPPASGAPIAGPATDIDLTADVVLVKPRDVRGRQPHQLRERIDLAAMGVTRNL